MWPQTGYPIEWAQFLFAVVAVLMTIWAIWDAYKDVVEVPHNEEGRRILGTRTILTEIFKMLAKIGFLVVGFASVLLPPPFYGAMTSQAAPPSEVVAAEKLAITITRVGIMWGTFWLMTDSIVSRRLRQLFIRRLKWNTQPMPPPSVPDPKILRKDALTTVHPIPRKEEVIHPEGINDKS